MLFYADEVTEKAHKMRSVIGNYTPNKDGRSCSFEYDRSKFQSSNFAKDFRETHGIFFDCGFLQDKTSRKMSRANSISPPRKKERFGSGNSIAKINKVQSQSNENLKLTLQKMGQDQD